MKGFLTLFDRIALRRTFVNNLHDVADFAQHGHDERAGDEEEEREEQRVVICGARQGSAAHTYVYADDHSRPLTRVHTDDLPVHAKQRMFSMCTEP